MRSHVCFRYDNPPVAAIGGAPDKPRAAASVLVESYGSGLGHPILSRGTAQRMGRCGVDKKNGTSIETEWLRI
jgi:hypothetical protein